MLLTLCGAWAGCAGACIPGGKVTGYQLPLWLSTPLFQEICRLEVK